MEFESSLPIIPIPSGIAAGNRGCGKAPYYVQYGHFLDNISRHLDWESPITPPDCQPAQKALTAVATVCRELAEKTFTLTQQHQCFIALGGDHSSAIGTWSGVAAASNGPIGLIWIDAHMDAHTPKTTPSGNIHGMPVACLLGHGDWSLTSILTDSPKLKPEHVALIGIRSYEEGEATLLERLGVRLYKMEEIHQRGIAEVYQEAIAHVTTGTVGYGLSIDLDGFDPAQAPGVGTPAPDGLNVEDTLKIMKKYQADSRCLGVEIVEFNPDLDQQDRTAHLVRQLIQTLF